MSNRNKRIWKIAINLSLIAIQTVLIYIFLGCPAFSPEQQLRREEKAYGIAHKEIIDSVSLVEYAYLYPYDQMLVSKGEYGVTAFCYDSNDYTRNELCYRKYDGDFAILTVSSVAGYNFSTRKEAIIPILVFDNLVAAQRAEMLISMDITNDAGIYKKDYLLTAYRHTDGYFLFELSAKNDFQLGQEGSSLSTLVALFTKDQPQENVRVTIPIEVSYYDSNDKLICIKSIG